MDHEFRRFKYLTDDEDKRMRLLKVLDEKDLSREDLMIILTTICISPDFYHNDF